MLLLDKETDLSSTLYKACIQGHEKVVDVLISRGADVNARSVLGNSLLAAIDGGHEMVVKLLLERGANVDTPGPESSALHVASLRGFKGIVKLLLDFGASINNDGALDAALVRYHFEVAELLLTRGAGIDAQEGKDYSSMLCSALERGHKKLAELLADSGVMFDNDIMLRTALQLDRVQVIEFLSARGGNIDTYNGEHGNILQTAVVQGSKKVVKLLLDRGENINARDGIYGSVLQLAVTGAATAIVKYILRSNLAGTGTQNDNHENLFVDASRQDYENIWVLLRQWGANVDAMQASFSDGEKFLGPLFQRRAKINGPEKSRESRQVIAGGSIECPTEQKPLSRIMGLNEQPQATRNSAFADYQMQLMLLEQQNKKRLLMARQEQDPSDSDRALELLELLLDRGADVNAQGGVFGNALQMASFVGNKEIVELLLNRGANVNMEGGKYGNALQAASVRGKKEVVELLLERGANVDARGGKYGSALRAVVHMSHSSTPV